MDLQIRRLATNLEPTECVGAAGPAHSVGEEENGQGRPFSDHFSRERERACEKYRLEMKLEKAVLQTYALPGKASEILEESFQELS